MIFTRNLINNYIDISKFSDEEIVLALNNLGFEVASVKPLCSGSDLIIGEVIEKKPHPNADRLSVCQVNVGEKVNQIVCGAPNVAKGQKVIVALEGCKLPIGLSIKKSNIRGEESNGMICSLKEIGFPQDLIDEVNEKGIYAIEKEDVNVGDKDPLKTLLFKDTIFELEITPNRPDAWSLIALAKELGIYFKQQLKPFESLDFVKKEVKNISKTSDCDFIALTKITNVKNPPKTHYEIAFYLKLLGFNLQGFLVDISNFVMLETGQPTHFYNAKKLNEKFSIEVKKEIQQKFLALDEKEYKITDEDIIITNGQNIISLAGIMGGKKEIVTSDTQEIIIETAIFNKTTIRKTSKRLNLYSYASSLFSKGRNKHFANLAIKRIIHYLSKHMPNLEIKETLIQDQIKDIAPITFDYHKIKSHLGIELEKKAIDEILKSLGCQIKDDLVFVPEERIDLLDEEDLWEEVARIYGYENIKATLNPSLPSSTPNDEMYHFINKIKTIFANLGSFETKNYALTSEEKVCDFAFDCQESLKLETFVAQNKTMMRQSVIPSLIDVCKYNFNHKILGVNIFEISRLYHQKGEEIELGLLHFGHLIKQNLFKKTTTSCLFTIKGYLNHLFEKLNIAKKTIEIKPMQNKNNFYNHHAACEVYIRKQLVGYFGEVNSFYLPKWKGQEIYVMQLNLQKLFLMQNSKLTYKPFSKFPIVNQDFTFVVDKDFAYKDIKLALQKLKLPFKYEYELIDIFVDPKIANKKALTLSFAFSSLDNTLNEEQIKQARTNVKKIIKDFNGELKD